MSYVHICIARCDAKQKFERSPAPLPVASSEVHAAEVIASSGSSQQSSALAMTSSVDAPQSYLWQIHNGGDTVGGSNLPVYIVFGADPTALANGSGMRRLLLVGESFDCHAAANGEKVAVINADITT